MSEHHLETTIRPRRVDHVAITVADADAVAAFYKDAFGARELYRLGPLVSSSMPKLEDGRDWTGAFLGVADATVTLIMLELAEGFGLELFQYDLPKSETATPPPSHIIGAGHIGIQVDDLDNAVKILRAKGCSFMAGPIDMDSGPVADKLFHYLRDPFGNVLELVANRK